MLESSVLWHVDRLLGNTPQTNVNAIPWQQEDTTKMGRGILCAAHAETI
jgi:hypothetical protein